MKDSPLDRYLLARPSLRAVTEWPILIVVSILGAILHFPKVPLNISGLALLLLGLIIHGSSHKVHGQAHRSWREVEGIVTEGIYSRIRHPGYLGLCLMYLGFGIWWGTVPALAVAVLFVVLTVLTALREEEVLREKFEEYEEYMRQVRWRFIPGVF
ncbi:MAG: hypothetical protein DRP94_06385 [Candidatus Latescibacterota bacterium]|nr:MAG: hypothetical protein DRP94_06385 [Candidatus Latescibacterota bacterium]RKY72490.1 MAG: hypothetical protein DRQ14_05830 [Candidatus Latescibacterota bacterium]HDH99852.1 isoprenylcysteine carboxylmethyltransferase family protein [Bacillota bacterium]